MVRIFLVQLTKQVSQLLHVCFQILRFRGIIENVIENRIELQKRRRIELQKRRRTPAGISSEFSDKSSGESVGHS